MNIQDWFCRTCDVVGTLEYDSGMSYEAIESRAKTDHHRKSPDCQAMPEVVNHDLFPASLD